MTIEDIAKSLSEHIKDVKIEILPGAKNTVSGVQVGEAALLVPAEKILEVCRVLKVTDQFAFDCLSSLTAVDRKDKFEVVYHLFSYTHRHSVTLKAVLPREEGHIETVESLWRIANWLEREVYDLFGIRFDNHSDLRRIMLPDDWEGHPLRKDYKEGEDYHGISTTRSPLLQ
jgi:NADH-quinone oxidoreductase subunit C